MVFIMSQCQLAEKCPDCGGYIYWDNEDKQRRCLACARGLISDVEAEEPKSITPVPRKVEPNEEVIPELVQSKSGLSPSGCRSDDGNNPPEVDSAKTLTIGKDTPAAQTQVTQRQVPDKEWYAPYEITFDRKHILFLIKHLDLLRQGVYPPDPYTTGYTDEPIAKKRKRISRRAYFTIPVELASEVDARLERAGMDGLIVEFVYSAESHDKSAIMSHLANMLRTDVKAIERRSQSALAYISGWKQKRSYREFIGHKKAASEKHPD